MAQDIDKKIALAIELHQKNQLAEAEVAYVDVLRIDPTHHQALFFLGLLYEAAGHIGRAIELLQETVLIYPHSVEAQYNLGLLLFKSKKYQEAIIPTENALTLQPSYCAAINVRGLIAYEMKQYEEALSYFNKALNIEPNNMSALNGAGLVLNELGRYSEALDIFEKALILYPANNMLLYNKSLSLFKLNKYNESIHNLDQILNSIEPNYIKALNSKANTLVRLGRKKEVIDHYKKVIALDADHYTARSELVYNLLCVCEWDDLEKHINAMVNAIPHFTIDEKDEMIPLIGHLLPNFSLANQYDLSRRYAMQLNEKMKPLKEKLEIVFNNDAKSSLNIGYISNDFRTHPLSQLIPEVFELHDRKRFTVYAYSSGPDDKSTMRQRIEKSVDHFVDISSMDEETIVKRVRNDAIDILVDLTGYAWATPSRLLPLRLAPIQVSYLGYLGTMAADFIDAIIADEFVIPPQYQQYYSEKIYYLPCFQPNDRQCEIAPKPSRTDCGLPEDALIFCCFNATYKITPSIFEIWCKLLRQVPNSILWLLSSNEWAVNNLKKYAAAHGIDADRLVFADIIPLDQHLGRLQCADLFLDTHPYNAGTTASNALWVGLPLITCVGDTFPSRMAGSLLRAIQIPELITYSLEDYYELALTLATDKEKREKITNKIKYNKKTEILFNTPFLVRHLEDLYYQMREDFADKKLRFI